MPSFPIVGARFRPPAQALTNGLPQETPVILRAEPTNPYDINAIQVLLQSSSLIDLEEDQINILNEELSSSGKTVEDITDMEEWHLGYIPREMAKKLRESGTINQDVEYPATFKINLRGQPQVDIIF